MNTEEIISQYEKENKKIRIKYIIITIVVAIIVAVFSSEFTTYYIENNLFAKGKASEDAEENIKVIGSTLKNFRKVIDEIYIGEIDEQKLLDETLKGYVNGLDDEYSEYFTAKEWEEFEAQALGNYVGVGIYMGVDNNGNVVVIAPIKDSPAEKAGLQKGDIIVSVDDESVLGIASDVVSSKIKGISGTKVKITIYRDSEEKYLDFEIERAEIKVYHVEEKMLDNNIGYISLFTFDEGCSQEFKEAYDRIKEKGAKKLILDLRDNTGGLVNESLDIIDLFLPKNETILITKDNSDKEEHSKTKKDQLIDMDLVILTNGYTASASEILVGALRDNQRAQTVGTKTYGKGVIQSVFMLDDDSALKLTTSEYYTPNKSKINKIGIEPDFIVEQEDDEKDNQLEKAIELLK